MKNTLVKFAAISLPAFLLPLSLNASSAKENVLVDFTDVRAEHTGASSTVVKSYDYVWGGWSKHVADNARQGALIQARINDGQLGEDKTMVRFAKTPVVELVFVVGQANKAAALNFFLADEDGTEQQWNIPLAGIAPGRESRCRLDLRKCTSEQKPGKVPGMNLNKVYTWRVQGDFSQSSVEILLVKLVGLKQG